MENEAPRMNEERVAHFRAWKDGDPPTLDGDNFDKGLDDDTRVAFVKQYELSKWYPLLGPTTTFESFEFSLEDLEIEALIAAHEELELPLIWEDMREAAKEALDGERGLRQHLSALQDKVNELLRQLGGAGFIKLGTRSPKDAPLKTPMDRHLQTWRDLLKQHAAHVSPLTDLSAFQVALTKALKVSCGKDVVDLLAWSTRSYKDLKEQHDLRQSGKPNLDPGASVVVLRKWNGWIADHPECELRGFVSCSKFTGLTQYNVFTHFPVLWKYRELVTKRVYEFWETEVHPKIAAGKTFPLSYVVDFAVVPKDTTCPDLAGGVEGGWDVFVIELNPFYQYAGPSLFDWAEDVDQLLKGPFESRFAPPKEEATVFSMRKYLPLPYLEVLLEERPSYEEKILSGLGGEEEEEEPEAPTAPTPTARQGRCLVM
eukprot:TRINITY_DN67405_c8_g2_i2.p1 TRINITY_DN67405_c8_g2~~TRINITY_DN67405_c8_g2_i2.p1  ORF type:complete len:428 (+),score=58.58 TRINITY_DN67405_c8_g2_i2:17-1300(+)